MVFIYSSFLWALAAVAMPVIIHLFNFRRHKKVYFTNVRFLKELRQESKSKSRLREILILTARCLTIACLVLAFAQPVYNAGSGEQSSGIQDISIYIDNSFSMQNVNRQGPLLEIAKTRAKEIVGLFGNSGRFQVITNDFEGRHQRFNTSENAIEIIDEIRISPVVRKLSAVNKRQQEFLKGSSGPNKKIYLLSDAQQSSFDLIDIEPDTNIKIHLIPIASNQVKNVFIDTCWFEEPLQQQGFIQKLHARIINSSSSSLDAGSARLVINDRQVAIASFSLDPYASTEVVFKFECKTSGFNYGSVKITDYPVTFDDELFFAFSSKVSVAICLINGREQPPENPFSSLFGNDSLFNLTVFPEQAIDYNFFKKVDVIVLNQIGEYSTGLLAELHKFTRKGGALVLIPPALKEPGAFNQALQAFALPLLGATDTAAVRIDNIDISTGFYRGVFEKMEERINLPLVNLHYGLLKGTRSNFRTILKLRNGNDFFGYNRFNNAQVYLFAAPLSREATNFNKHALFVPTFYRICFNSLQPYPLFYNVSENVAIGIKGDQVSERPPHIRHTGEGPDVIPEQRRVDNSLVLLTNNQVDKPGFYNIIRNDSAELPLAFNYSRAESNLTCYSVPELESVIGDHAWKNVKMIDISGENISNEVLMGAEGKKLWKIFIILAFVFITIELTLLRLLK